MPIEKEKHQKMAQATLGNILDETGSKAGLLVFYDGDAACGVALGSNLSTDEMAQWSDAMQRTCEESLTEILVSKGMPRPFVEMMHGAARTIAEERSDTIKELLRSKMGGKQ